MPDYSLLAGSGPLWTLDGLRPRVDREAWVAPNATVIGDVEIGARSSIWFNCVLRGDTNQIRIGRGSNLQDGTIVHVNPGPGMDCFVGDAVTVGHGAILHACRLEDHAFVGMGALVLDQAVIEGGGVLAAGGVLTQGKRIGPCELWAGTPARFVRILSPDELARFAGNAPSYVANASRFRAGLRG